MTTTPKNPDITIRGGLINVPSSAKPQPIPRHRPNTPVNKKGAKPKADHIHAPTEPATIPPAPQPEPEGEIPDVPAPTSESD